MKRLSSEPSCGKLCIPTSLVRAGEHQSGLVSEVHVFLSLQAKDQKLSPLKALLCHFIFSLLLAEYLPL